MKKVVFLLFWMGIIGGIVWSQGQVWRITERSFFTLEKLPGVIPPANILRPALLGFDQMVADIFWLQSVQYAGANSGRFGFSALPEYLELVTDLDPHFLFPYSFGAVVLPNMEQALPAIPRLLEKGIFFNPLSGELYVSLGFYYSFYAHDDVSALHWYETCVRSVPNCPRFARNALAHIHAKSGEYAMAVSLWREKLQIHGLSPEEGRIALQKFEEALKLSALDCAFSQHPKAENIDDLVGSVFQRCPAFADIPSEELRSLDEALDLFHITSKTLVSPFPHNPFVIKEHRVRTRLW